MWRDTIASMRKRTAIREQKEKKTRLTLAASTMLKSGELVELVYDPKAQETAFLMQENEAWRITDAIEDGERTVAPFPANNATLQHKVVLLPSEPVPYGSQGELVEALVGYIHRYIDFEEEHQRLVAYYVLFTWLFDHFNEVPYLRIKGDYGTGKTRFLQIIGSVCYRSIFANGASTVSPIFHMLDTFGGTLIVDEADFRLSDETAEIAKIFNNGNVRGMPVLRAQATRERDFNPRVFQVFGPKVVAMRGDYADAALESRFLTLRSRPRNLRDNVPINLPAGYQDEALTLRNKLLAYRLDTHGSFVPVQELANPELSYRDNQIVIPLLSIIEDEKERRWLGEIVAEIVRRASSRKREK